MNAQESVRKIQQGISSVTEEIDRNILRPVHRDTHKSISVCYSYTTASAADIQKCINNSTILIHNMTTVVNSNLMEYQHRIQRCVQSCEDETSDYLIDSASKNADRIYSDVQDKCMCICSDKHFDKLGLLQKKIEKDLHVLLKK